MKKNKLSINKVIIAFVFTAMIMASAVLLSLSESKAILSVSSNKNATYGSVEFLVTDGFSEQPLAETKVVIVETGEVYYTDEFGKTPKILVPILRDNRFDKVLAKPWGEISVIFYNEDYLEYALFYLQVFEGQTRENVQILMFTEKDARSGQPFSIIEGPNRLWVNEIINKYQDKE